MDGRVALPSPEQLVVLVCSRGPKSLVALDWLAEACPRAVCVDGGITAWDAYACALLWGIQHVSSIAFSSFEEPREVLCSLLVTVVAIAANALVIGQVASTLSDYAAYARTERQGRQSVTSFLADRSVPRSLQERIHEYYDFSGGVTRSRPSLMPSLPKALSFELEVFLKRAILKTPLFSECTVHQTMALVPLIEPEAVMPGRIIVREKFKISAMYAISRGRILLAVAEKVVGVRFVGETVGEDCLVDESAVAPWTAIAADWCDLLRLRALSFRALAAAHPQVLHRIKEYVAQQLDEHSGSSPGGSPGKAHQARLKCEAKLGASRKGGSDDKLAAEVTRPRRGPAAQGAASGGKKRVRISEDITTTV